MNAVLEFPAITPDAASAAVMEQAKPQIPATLKATVLAQFEAIRPDIKALGAKYANVAYDVKTTKGMDEAKAARLELREQGRYMLQRTEERIKKEANELKGIVAAQVADLVKLIEPAEKAIDEQIKAEEKRKAEEKAENERKETERKQKLQAGIAGIRGMLERAAGQPAEKIEAAIKAMESWTFTAERWQEFAVQAADACCQTVEKLRQLHAQAVDAERLRAENARLAAELAARPTPAPTAAPAPSQFCKDNNTRGAMADLERAREWTDEDPDAATALPGEPVEKADPPQDVALEPALIQKDTTTGAAPQQASDHQRPEADAAPGMGTAGAPALTLTPSTTHRPTLNIGAICARFGEGFSMTRSYIEDRLGVKPAGTGQRGVAVWSEDGFKEIKRALVAVIEDMQ